MSVLLFPGRFDPMHFGQHRLLQAAMEAIKVRGVEVLVTNEEGEECRLDRIRLAREAVNNAFPLPLSEMVSIVDWSADEALESHDAHGLVERMCNFHPTETKFLLLGREGAHEAARWRKYKAVSRSVEVAVARDARPSDLAVLRKRFSVRVVPYKPTPICSLQVREILAKGGKSPWRYVPRAAYRMMEEKGLYGVRRPEPCPAQ